MHQPLVNTSQMKPVAAAPAAPVKVDAAAVTALQDRVAQMIGSGALSSAPYTYHH